MPFESMVYVGDNVNKDFQAPKQLGMKWIWVKNADGLYYQDSDYGKFVCSIDELRNSLICD